MKLISLLSRCLFLVQALVFFNSTYSFSAAPGDSVKPVIKVDKKFLIVAHIVYNKDTIAGITPAEITTNITTVNNYFAPIGVSFEVCEFRYIYNYQFDNLARTPAKVNEPAKIDTGARSDLLAQYWVGNRINMFFVAGISGGDAPCGDADLGGITNTGPVGIILKKSCQDPLEYAHQLGHYFGLYNTFETGFGTELVNGSNCLTAGDGICDTPADPEQSGANTSSCIYTSFAKDANNAYYEPDVSNIMSSFSTSCKCRFTNEQLNKMANYYLSNPFEW